MQTNQNQTQIDPNAVATPVDATQQVAQQTPVADVQTAATNQVIQGAISNPYITANQNVANAQPFMQNPYINQTPTDATQQVDANQNGFFNNDFLKGALIGAGVAFLLTNKTTQKAIFQGFSKGSELVQAGIEELKERIEDAKAQTEARE